MLAVAAKRRCIRTETAGEKNSCEPRVLCSSPVSLLLAPSGTTASNHNIFLVSVLGPSQRDSSVKGAVDIGSGFCERVQAAVAS